MKKLVGVLSALVSMGTVFCGYKIEMKNESDVVVRVKIDYVNIKGLDICKSDEVILQPNEYHSLDAGLCCTDKITIIQRDFSNGKWYEDHAPNYFNVPAEAGAFGCGGFAFTIFRKQEWPNALSIKTGVMRPAETRKGSGSRMDSAIGNWFS